MERPDKHSDQQRQHAATRETPRSPASGQRHDRSEPQAVEPADMRLEPQPEEPGYGHGV